MDFCLRCNAWHDGLGCPINAEIARLRAELVDKSRDEIAKLKADLSSTRAALDKEREACDEARRLAGNASPFDPEWNARMRAWCVGYSARRAAEAKE